MVVPPPSGATREEPMMIFPDTWKVTKHRLMVAIALFLPIILWLSPALSPKNLLLFGGIDGCFYFYPMTACGMDLWRHGEIPLWSSLIHCGFPLLADGQGALLYPLNLLFYLLFSSPMANNLSIVLQTLLTAAFMYAFVRRLGSTPWSAVVAGWIWVFFGPIGQSIGSPALNGLTWWPLLFLIADRLAKRFDRRLVVLAASLMGMSWLGGFPQTAFYGIFASSIYLLFQVSVRSCGRWRSAIAPVCGWGAAVVLGIALAAPQILPTMEMSRMSIRAGGADFTFASFGSMFPTGFAGLIFPKWSMLADYMLAGSNLFTGYICLAAVVLTIRRKDMPPVHLFFWVLVLLGCVLGMGKYTPLYKLVHMVPGFGFFRYPYRFLYWTMFGIAVLCPAGLDRLLASPAGGLRDIRRMIAATGIVVGGTIVASALASMILKVFKNDLVVMANTFVNKAIIGKAYKMQGQEYYAAKINRMIVDIGRAATLVDIEFLASLLIAVAAIVMLMLWLRRAISNRTAKMALYLLIALSVAAFLRGPYWSMLKTAELSCPPMVVSCEKEKEPYRIYNVNSPGELSAGTYFQRDRLYPNFNMLFGIANVGVYSALGFSRYHSSMGALGSVNLAFGPTPATELDVARYKRLLDLCNVRFVTSGGRLNVPGLTLVSTDGQFLYRNEECLPRAFVVPKAVVVNDDRALLDSLHSPVFDPRSTVLLESDPGVAKPGGISSVATIVGNENQRMVLEADGPGWLVISEMYYPGWHARIDGKKATIHRGDYVFRALSLEPGHHRIELYYESRYFQAGLLIMAVSAVVLLILLAVGRRRADGDVTGKLS
jgi:hypothetical protein